MASIDDKKYSSNYSGLATNIYVSLAVTGVCLVAFEVLRQIPRRRGRPSQVGSRSGWWRPLDDPAGAPFTSTGASTGGGHAKESWEFGYVYQARHWAVPSTPLMSRLPLVWIWEAIKVSERDLPRLCGLDHTVHVRYLRCCYYYLLLQCFTTLPVLLPIHLKFAPADVASSSMLRASLSSLVRSPTGQKYTFVHAILIAWLVGTWSACLIWIAWGGIKYRREAVESTLHRARLEAHQQLAKAARMDGLPPTVRGPSPLAVLPGGSIILDDPKPSAESPLVEPVDFPGVNRPAHPASTDALPAPRGWKQRTVLVSNIPPDMRDQACLMAYFDDGLRSVLKRRARKARERAAIGEARSKSRRSVNMTGSKSGTTDGVEDDVVQLRPGRRSADSAGNGDDGSDEDDDDGADDGCASGTGIVEEVVVVRRMLELHKLRQRRINVLGALEHAHVELGRAVLGALAKWRAQHGIASSDRSDEKLDVAAEKLRRGKEALAQNDADDDGEDGEEWSEEERMAILDEALGRFLDPEEDGFWTVLHALPRALLDRYQPRRYGRLSPSVLIRRKPNPPKIDYLSAKLALLSMAIDDGLTKPLVDYKPSSSAFITFRSPEIARLAVRKMGRHQSRRLCCNVAMAPDYRDLEWFRLMKKEFRTDAVKGYLVSVAVWAFIIFWVIPLTFFVALFSAKNLATILPPLKDALDKHSRAAEVTTSLIPTLLVSILTLLIPLLLFLISTHFETIVTKSALHDVILTRYYRFLICEVVVFFCIGAAALQAFIVNFKKVVSISLLETIASSFPQAAPFFVLWIILETSLHSFFELGMFGLPMLQWIFARRKDLAPRKRSAGTNPRFFSAYYLIPIHITVLFISNLFAVLNPLVLPFGAIYFIVAAPILKNQFIHVYQSQYDTGGLRPIIRFTRYTLDGLILTEIVYMALSVILNKPPLIAVSVLLVIITAAIKLSLTRAIKGRFAALDRMEADGLFKISQGIADGFERTRPVDLDRPLPALPGASPLLQRSDSLSSSDDAHVPKADRPVNAKMFNAWRLQKKTRKNKQGGYLNVPAANRMSMSLAPLRFASDEESDDDDKSVQPKSGHTPTRRKTLSRRMHNMSSHMVHPILDRIDARFLPPCDGERPSPIDERYGSPATVAPTERPGLPHAPAEEAVIDTLVRPRVGPQPWTDAPADDRRYSYQPPYMDALATTLWLPRHPLSRLDLDDTVDVKRSLETSAGGAGELGASDLFVCTDDGPVALHDSPHEIDDELAERDGDEAEQQALSPTSAQSADSTAGQKSYFLAIPTASPSPHLPSPASPTASRFAGRSISIREPSRSPSHPSSPADEGLPSRTPPRRSSAAPARPAGPRSPLTPASFVPPPPTPSPNDSPGGPRRAVKPKGPRRRSNTVVTTASSSGGAGGEAPNAYLQELLDEEAERQRKAREEEDELAKREGSRQKQIGRRATISSR